LTRLCPYSRDHFHKRSSNSASFNIRPSRFPSTPVAFPSIPNRMRLRPSAHVLHVFPRSAPLRHQMRPRRRRDAAIHIAGMVQAFQRAAVVAPRPHTCGPKFQNLIIPLRRFFAWCQHFRHVAAQRQRFSASGLMSTCVPTGCAKNRSYSSIGRWFSAGRVCFSATAIAVAVRQGCRFMSTPPESRERCPALRLPSSRWPRGRASGRAIALDRASASGRLAVWPRP